ncbi:inositol-tetrakisphosphate 1-kinase 3-like isoform X1 [Zingiber officinale]|uniref:inositol-tetrakisphosphate 1-kinase 3-like isoform X1 n=1 Tax=Zingiber officinale TaxID=94328 RepID=UPI001C4D4EDC|nr:inositol-tetrakisphosphate 1-kinase 3-like isoform X1 [Zingiber officinale]
MRFDLEIPVPWSDEDKENEQVHLMSLPRPPPQKRLIVGYALTSKKVKSFFQPKLERLARKKGIIFVAIDQSRSLLDQGPFDIVLHKFTGKEWQHVLEDYREENPGVTVLDPPISIQHLHNRQSMLQVVVDLNLSDSYGKVGVPKQLVISKEPSSIPEAVSKARLGLPLVVKPLLVDGSAKSHELSLAYDECSLSMLDPPLVLQEFINHGGILFKVYIVGEAVKVVRRFSLPDVDKREQLSNKGAFRFPRVSCAAASADDADLDPSIAELPPRPLLEKLAKELRNRLGLRLFNIDIIRERGTRDRFYVIDINYFPGYSKMPEYEHIFTDFLLGIGQSKYRNRRRLSSSRTSRPNPKTDEIASSF